MSWGPPRAAIEAECRRRGRTEVLDGCLALLAGAGVGSGVDPALLRALAGPAANAFLGGEDRQDAYWLRVWGMRGLLWALPPRPWGGAVPVGCVAAVGAATSDPHWRVRELAAKVVARHALDDLLDEVAGLRADPVPRVAAAAQRAFAALTGTGR